MLFASLQALELHGSNAYQKISFIYPDFWLDSIHMPDYVNLDWGQNILGFPCIVRKLFKEYRPNYPSNKFVTWQDYQHIRHLAIVQLKQQEKIDFLIGSPLKLKHTQGGSYIKLDTIDLALPSSKAI